MLAALKGIQLGKIKAPDGWIVPVTEVDFKKYCKQANGNNGAIARRESVGELV